jgi:hypothetical protein
MLLKRVSTGIVAVAAIVTLAGCPNNPSPEVVCGEPTAAPSQSEPEPSCDDVDDRTKKP